MDERRSRRPCTPDVDLDRVADVRGPRAEEIGGVPYPELGVLVHALLRADQPPPAVMAEDGRIYSGEILDEHRDLRPSPRELHCTEQRDLAGVRGLRNAVDLVRAFDQIGIRQVPGTRQRRRARHREAVGRVVERANVPTGLAVVEVLAEDVQPPVAHDPERVGEEGLPTVEWEPVDVAIWIPALREQRTG